MGRLQRKFDLAQLGLNSEPPGPLISQLGGTFKGSHGTYYGTFYRVMSSIFEFFLGT